jgi:hypothetical protein
VTDSCHPDDGGDTFLLNVDFYKRHTAFPFRYIRSALVLSLLVCVASVAILALLLA